MNASWPVSELLENPSSYPHDTSGFEIHETHISRVFLVGPFAYKLKKPVSLGFLDYSTPELRRHYCEEELRLNRRLAPEIYLGVVSVRDDDGRVFLDLEESGAGREIDTIVRMKRLPPEAMLHSLLREGKGGREHIDLLVDVLLPFYRNAPQSLDPGGHGSPDVLRETMVSNLREAEPLAGELLSERRLQAIRCGQLSFLTLRREVFEERVADGRIRDGHGDLRAEHVAYVPGCIVMDCIEFRESFRVIDVAADLAFLKMDLEFLGAPGLGDHLIDRYVEASGDAGMRSVLGFYLSYRAAVRGKVDGIKLAQGGLEPERRRLLENRARRYFELAHFHTLSFHRPALVLIGGLSGTGKSTLSRLLAEKLGAALVRSDVIRKELAGVPPGGPAPRGFGEGIYSDEHTSRTYRNLAERAADLLEDGATVIADATFSRREHRELLRDVAHRAGARHVHFECRVPGAVAARRMKRRATEGSDASDATAALQEAQRAAYEPCAAGEAVVLDTGGPPASSLDLALASLREHLGED